jgi:hypothetical protein
MDTHFCNTVGYGECCAHYPAICLYRGCVIQLHGSIVFIRTSIRPTLSHCSEYAWASGTLLIVNICPAVVESDTHFCDITSAWYTSSRGWWNFQQCARFTLMNQITLRTTILDRVSSRPAIFKFIVWWNNTLLVLSHGCMLTQIIYVPITWWNLLSDDTIPREACCRLISWNTFVKDVMHWQWIWGFQCDKFNLH